MGTTSLDYSRALLRAITAGGGRYVEAPISGSRIPAERGELVAMMAGAAEDKARVEKDPAYFGDIYIMDADGSHVRRLTEAPGYDGGPFLDRKSVV